jgi:hypothetical protein
MSQRKADTDTDRWGESLFYSQGEGHENRGHLLAAKIEGNSPLLHKTTGSIEISSLDGGIDKDVRKECAGNHGSEVIEKCPANSHPPVFEWDTQEPDFIHIQPRDADYPVFGFVDGHIEKSSPLLHTFGSFDIKEPFPQCARNGGIVRKAGADKS